MQHSERTKLAASIVVTAEMIGHDMSPNTADAMSRELATMPLEHVTAALRRCARECRGRLTLADVLARVDDGHPGEDMAWALCHRDESETIVWTDEMSESYGVARPLVLGGANIGARMAFKDAYRKAVLLARDGGKRAQWNVSLGTDPSGRRAALESAVASGKLPADVLPLYLPAVAAVHKALPSGDMVPLADLITSLRLVKNGSQS